MPKDVGRYLSLRTLINFSRYSARKADVLIRHIRTD